MHPALHRKNKWKHMGREGIVSSLLVIFSDGFGTTTGFARFLPTDGIKE